MSDRLVLLTAGGDLHWLLLNRLAQDFPIAAVVCETDQAAIRRAMLRHRLRKLGYAATAAQLLTILGGRLPHPAAARRRAELLAGADCTPPAERFAVLAVPRINDAAVVELLQREQPAVVVVSGTSLLRAPLLQAAPLFLNIHCGLTPRYRGVHGGFWAVWEGRPQDAGVTIHRVDRGVDTGGIVAQERIVVDRQDSLETLVAKQYRVGAEAMAASVAAARRGELPNLPGVGESRQWYHPTPWQIVQFRRQLRRLTGP
ncbi:MAG: hypothetical protein IT204_11515 [Fimbriimonadaceae bacterium]|nr:hypothetical protein [Fimbriimonadaceae bacterium]